MSSRELGLQFQLISVSSGRVAQLLHREAGNRKVAKLRLNLDAVVRHHLMPFSTLGQAVYPWWWSSLTTSVVMFQPDNQRGGGPA